MSRRLGIFAGFVAVALATRAVLLGVDVIDLDEASYLVGSWEILRGGRLYADFADHHPPLAYLYYAFAQVLLGRGMLAVHLLTNLATVPLTALGVSAFFRHDRRGAAAGLLYLVYGAAFLGHDMLSANCELLLLLPATWAVVLLRDEAQALDPRRTALAGALLGVAVLFKYQAVLWLPALGIAVVFAGGRHRAVPALLALGAGFSLPLIATYAWFAATGGAEGFLYWNLVHNLRYTANPIPPSEAAQRALGKLLPFLLVTAGLWWCGRRSLALLPRYQAILVASLVLLTLPAAVLGFRFYPHYFVQLYVPLALAAAPHAAEILRRPLPAAGRWFLAWTAFCLAGFTVANAVLYYARTGIYEETRPVFREMAERLHADPCIQGASLFVWGFAPMFYSAADLPMASRFIFPESTLVGYVPGNTASARGEVATRDRVSTEHWDWLMADLARKKPTFILDTAPSGLHRWQSYPLADFPRLAAFVRDGYEDAGDVEGVRIYRRRGCTLRDEP